MKPIEALAAILLIFIISACGGAAFSPPILILLSVIVLLRELAELVFHQPINSIYWMTGCLLLTAAYLYRIFTKQPPWFKKFFNLP